MNKKLIAIISLSLLTANVSFATSSYFDVSEFNGEDFFTPPAVQQKQAEEKAIKTGIKHSNPPLKKLRLKIKKNLRERKSKNLELAPVAPIESIYDSSAETSVYASQDIKDNFDETINPDGFESSEDTINENGKKHFWNRMSRDKQVVETEPQDNIILDCKNIDYDTDNFCIIATGDVVVNFVEQDAVLKADKITYDRMNGTIKAEDNVRIYKSGQEITGEYIFVDLNEENALIERPITTNASITIKSEKGYVYGDKITQENGNVVVDNSFPIQFKSKNRGPMTSIMLKPKKDDDGDPAEKIVKLKARDIILTRKGDLDVISLKKAAVYKGSKRIVKIPSLKIYTNRNFDFVETNAYEIGSFRGLGLYTGPGMVFEIPGGSVFKAIPMLNYKSGFGIGIVGRYNNASNWTQFGYGTANEEFLLRGRQELDNNLYMQYSINDYMKEWFLGRRRPKYGASLVYEKSYGKEGFVLKKLKSDFSHRVDLGYYQDYDNDYKFRTRSQGTELGTTRARYMAQISQDFYKRKNEEKQTQFSLSMLAQMSAALYGTGDTQVIGRIGPSALMQYKRWMQQIVIFQSAYEDNSPMPIFDSYRYGQTNVMLREYYRINDYLTLCWFGSINVSNDAPNDKDFQENAFYISVGPDEVKFTLGYDFIRERMHFIVEVMMDAKGSQVEYEKLVIKQDKEAKKKDNLDEPKEETSFQQGKPVLEHAVVEDIKTVEDVI